MKALSVTISPIVSTENLPKQLEFFEKNNLMPIWPDQNHFEGIMAGFFERIAETRALNKKHIQRRAFIDLLIYLKDQGLR